jgi:hypothetical protein
MEYSVKTIGVSEICKASFRDYFAPEGQIIIQPPSICDWKKRISVV